MGNKFISYISKAIIILAIIIGAIFTFTLFSNAEDSGNKTSKNEEEISYLDTKLLSIINYLNNIDLENYKIVLTKVESESSNETSSTSEEGQEEDTGEGTDEEEKTISKMEQEKIVTEDEETVDWSTIEGELELLCSTWPTIILDLYDIGVSSEDILGFSDNLDQAILNVKSQDKTLSCMYLAKLYSYLPTFLDSNLEDEIKKETLAVKTYIVNAYAYAETENWDKIEVEVSKAENTLESLVNDARYVNDQRKYNINKSYILVEELKNSLSTQDTGIFYVKYKNILEELNTLT